MFRDRKESKDGRADPREVGSTVGVSVVTTMDTTWETSRSGQTARSRDCICERQRARTAQCTLWRNLSD